MASWRISAFRRRRNTRPNARSGPGWKSSHAVGRLKRPDGAALQSRVGIATGLVVAGAAGVQGEQTVVGDTPNLAARPQSLAEPGCVLVSPSTHRLTGDFFEYLFAGEHEVKGYREPVPVWRALGESAIESRFISAHAAAAGPIIGREREMAFLADAWQRATQGNGHVVVLSGEAGMGKSRLLEALAERVRDAPHRLLRAQCSPYHGNSVLYPIVQLLRHRLDLRRDLSDAENLQRVERMLERIGRSTRQASLLMAELLELRAQETLSQAEMTPAHARTRRSKSSKRSWLHRWTAPPSCSCWRTRTGATRPHKRSSSGCWAGSRAIARWSSSRTARN